MIEHPILFSPPMVKAILEGRKTQTRRVVKDEWQGLPLHEPTYQVDALKKCPYGQPGDRLWVREALYLDDENEWRRTADDSLIELDADDERVGHMLSWAHHKETARCPSMHMPRFASRLTLEVTGVRVELLREIVEEDAKAEGITAPMYPPGNGQSTYRLAYRHLWDSLNAKRGFGWDKNPWVWVVEFKRAAA